MAAPDEHVMRDVQERGRSSLSVEYVAMVAHRLDHYR
jgi:hypothetical protein